MEKIKNIYQKINAVMKEVKYIQKSSKKVNNLYSFVSHDAVTGELHMPMAEHGIVMVPSILDLTKDGNHIMVKMDVVFVNADDPSDRVSMISYGQGIDPSDKGVGKAVSYAVKYALLKMFCLETGDDAERDNFKYEPAPAVSDKIIEKKLKKLQTKCSPEDPERLNEYLNHISHTLQKPFSDVLLEAEDSEKFDTVFSKWKDNKRKVA